MIKLIKTTAGNNGAPLICNSCNSLNFIKSGKAWHCGDCCAYVPEDFTQLSLRNNLKKLELIHIELKEKIMELEELVR